MDNDMLFLTILISLIFIFFIYPKVIKKTNNEKFENDSKVMEIINNKCSYDVPIRQNYFPRIDKNICSKQCCKHIQWPVPFNTKNPIVSDDTLKNFIPSNLSCNGGENGGCVCLTKDDFNYLANHGQN